MLNRSTLMMLVLAAVLTTCGLATPNTSPAQLDYTKWVLMSLNGNSLVEGSTIIIRFWDGNEIDGTAGCNSYGARYTTSGNDFNITARRIDMTDFDCDVPESVMQQEAAYFGALADAAAYRVTDDQLIIDDSAGDTTLVFTMKEKPSIDPALNDTEWVLTSLNGDSLVEGSRITMDFVEGAVTGFAGCNYYGGEYTAADEGFLTIPEICCTEMLCPAPDVMQQEAAYLEVLSYAATYRVVGNHLEIDDSAGDTTLVFTMKENFLMDPGGLVGTAWKLILWNGHSPLEDSTITIAFAKGEISGHAGRRDYVGTYIAGGDGIRVTSLGARGVARKPDSQSLVVQEGQYTTNLSMATDYRLSDGRLEIFTAPGDVLIYEPLPDDADIRHEGITWTLTEIIIRDDVSSPIPGTTIAAYFENGKISGTAGCNQYFGSYTIVNGILIEDLSATEMACPEPDSIMQQEAQYLNILRDVMSYTILENQLTLITGDGRALAYQTESDIPMISKATTPAEKSTPGFEILWTMFSVVILFLSKRRRA